MKKWSQVLLPPRPRGFPGHVIPINRILNHMPIAALLQPVREPFVDDTLQALVDGDIVIPELVRMRAMGDTGFEVETGTVDVTTAEVSEDVVQVIEISDPIYIHIKRRNHHRVLQVK